MKKSILLLTFLVWSLFSCSKSDNNNNNNSNSDVLDINGNIYQTVTICNQTWMKSNLNVSKYRNGDEIPQVTDGTQWANLTTGAWCYYQNNTSNGPVYGKLYNWYALNDPRGLAPTGWHIPSFQEWNGLYSCLGDNLGGKMKEGGTLHWLTPNTGATNESGFTGLPNGLRSTNGIFGFLGKHGYWWSTTEYSSSEMVTYDLNYDNGGISTYNINKTSGLSVRCVKD